jgi:hypothetical protein
VEAASASSERLTWSYNPWKERTGLTWLLFGVNCAVIAVVYFGFPGDPAVLAFMLLAALFMFGATLSMLVPINYQMDERGVTVHFMGTHSFRPWAHYRNCYVHSNGIFLTSMKRPSGLDPFRGHFLLYRKSGKEEIVAYARRHIQT